MRTLQFTKYHGLGNDFIIVDTESPTEWTANQARVLCDRHRGIGADGVLLVGPAQAGVRASMRVLNADGSEPEMCGNGLRCVALHLAEVDELTHAVFEVATGAGVLGCTVDRKGSDANVRIAMGKAKVAPEPLVFDAGGRHLSFDRVSTGNPHAIVFDEPFDLSGRRPVGTAGVRLDPGRQQHRVRRATRAQPAQRRGLGTRRGPHTGLWHGCSR